MSDTQAESKALVSLSNGTCLCDKSAVDIVALLDDYAIGQQDAKETLDIAVDNHYKRLDKQKTSEVEISKSNILPQSHSRL